MAHALMAASSLLFSYVTDSHVAMREKPSEKDSKVVSEAFFSEPIRVLEESGDWAKIETAVDTYAGWVKKSAYCQRETKYPAEHIPTTAKVSKLRAHLYDREDTEYGPIKELPYESLLEVVEPVDPSSKSRWIKVSLPDGSVGYIQRGCVTLNPQHQSLADVCKLSQEFLGLGYIWGGRSSFGYDCSGFVQMLYRQMGVSLPRDSKDQIAWEGFVPVTKEALTAGDAVFFGLDATKIRHMGMYLGNGQFIHATVAENKPWIRISNLDEPEWNGQGRFTFVAFRTLRK